MFLLIKNQILKATFFCSLLLFISCTKDKFKFKIEVPNKLEVKKDSTLTFYIKIFNSSKSSLFFSNIKTSCQCIVLSKRQLMIESKRNDSIRIKLFGTIIGSNTESLILTNEKLKKFKNIRINYEVNN